MIRACYQKSFKQAPKTVTYVRTVYDNARDSLFAGRMSKPSRTVLHLRLGYEVAFHGKDHEGSALVDVETGAILWDAFAR
jgi:hypothetical protein